MTEVPLDSFDIVAASDRGYRVGMPHVVKTGIRSADRGSRPLKVTVDDVVAEMVTQAIGKNIIFIFPG